jgi:hypothetical protein
MGFEDLKIIGTTQDGCDHIYLLSHAVMQLIYCNSHYNL